MSNEAWNLIFEKSGCKNHDFNSSPFFITADEIKNITKIFTETGKRELRILCKQDSKNDRPQIFKDLGLFILPVKNGKYAIIKGEGYVDIPNFKNEAFSYSSNLGFNLETSLIGNSEMQHLAFAYASSIIRTFI